MDQPPQTHPPFAGVEEAVQDIAAAVAFICRRCATPAVDLVGFSWSTILAARYAGAHPRTVRHLALYAPLFAERNPSWLDRIADPRDRNRLAPAFGAYRLVTGRGASSSGGTTICRAWLRSCSARGTACAELVFETLAALDPRSALQVPRAFRCPERRARRSDGGIQRAAALRSGEACDAGAAGARRAGHHVDRDRRASVCCEAIASPVKRYRVIAPGSHFLCIEKIARGCMTSSTISRGRE